MPPVGFEPTISAGERPWTYALDRAATETGRLKFQYLFLTEKKMGKQKGEESAQNGSKSE